MYGPLLTGPAMLSQILAMPARASGSSTPRALPASGKGIRQVRIAAGELCVDLRKAAGRGGPGIKDDRLMLVSPHPALHHHEAAGIGPAVPAGAVELG
jgi:hypothetical protein